MAPLQEMPRTVELGSAPAMAATAAPVTNDIRAMLLPPPPHHGDEIEVGADADSQLSADSGSVDRARGDAGSSHYGSASDIDEPMATADHGMQSASTVIDDADDVMTVEEAARHYKVLPFYLCVPCRLVFPSVPNRYVHDQWRHNIYRTDHLEVLAGESYCLNCNVDEGPTKGRAHFRIKHELTVDRAKTGPAAGGMAKKKDKADEPAEAKIAWPPNNDYRQYRGWRYATYHCDSEEAYRQLILLEQAHIRPCDLKVDWVIDSMLSTELAEQDDTWTAPAHFWRSNFADSKRLNMKLLQVPPEFSAWVIPADVGGHWMFVLVANGRAVIYDSLAHLYGRQKLLLRTWEVLAAHPGGLRQKPTTVFAAKVPQQEGAGDRTFHCHCIAYLRLLVLHMLGKAPKEEDYGWGPEVQSDREDGEDSGEGVGV